MEKPNITSPYKRLNDSDLWSKIELEDGSLGATGDQVEEFIKSNFVQSVEIAGTTVSVTKNGETISKEITVIPPLYEASIEFTDLRIQDIPNTWEANYTSNINVKLGVRLKVWYTQGADTYNLSRVQQVTFKVGPESITRNVTPVHYASDSVQYVDITELINKLKPATLASFQVTGKSTIQFTSTETRDVDTVSETIKIHKILVNYSGKGYVKNNKAVFSIDGLGSDYTSYCFDYYLIPIDEQNIVNLQKETPIVLSLQNSVTVPIPESGIYSIYGRISQIGSNTYYSDYILTNIIACLDYENHSAQIIVNNIANSIQNCGAAKYCDIYTTAGQFGGDVLLNIYLDTLSSTLFNSPTKQYSKSIISSGKNTDIDYYEKEFRVFNEFAHLQGEKRYYLGFEIFQSGETLGKILRQFSINRAGNLQESPFFEVLLVQNENNINDCFNYTSGENLNFSQITGGTTTVFNNLNPNCITEWAVEEEEEGDYETFLVPALNNGIFVDGLDLSDLLKSDQGFTLELMLKHTNVNGDEPSITLGNLQIGPGVARCWSDTKSLSESAYATSVFVNSRADFEKEEITHLLITYQTKYKPSTYNNIYDELFPNYSTKTSSDNSDKFSVLKFFINGTINREIEVTDTLLKDPQGNFKLQIAPTTSDLHLYILRTYEKALNYAEILKNRLSSIFDQSLKYNYFVANDILSDETSKEGQISLYKAMKYHNVFVLVLPHGEKPLYYGNAKTDGSGNSDYVSKTRVSLIHYKDPDYADYSGRFSDYEYKALGSSAKKYLLAHNVQLKLGSYVAEALIEADGSVSETVVNPLSNEVGATKYYQLKDDESGAKAVKLVGKVNTASSMQSHKIGATKLFNNAYKEIFAQNLSEKMPMGGRKAVYEDAFLYFYYIAEEGEDISKIQLSDLYSVEVIAGKEYITEKDVKFFGFFTFGSAKADKPSFGYDKNKTPEYLMFEGADNNTPGANFKLPWASFLTFRPRLIDGVPAESIIGLDSQKISGENSTIEQQPKSVTVNNHIGGLLIAEETVRFEINSSEDPLDIDFGCTEIDECNPDTTFLFESKVSAKGSSLDHFVNFFNSAYEFDFTNFEMWSGSTFKEWPEFEMVKKVDALGNPVYDENGAQVEEKLVIDTRNTSKKYWLAQNCTIQVGGAATNTPSRTYLALLYDLYRWDKLRQIWVPAGLHHTGSDWEHYNLETEYQKILDYYRGSSSIQLNEHTKEVLDNQKHNLNLDRANGTGQNFVNDIIFYYLQLFKAAMYLYLDVEDVAYHQAFIRVVSGTDNRAKNTYFYIIGKIYENKKEEVDGKVRTLYTVKIVETINDSLKAVKYNCYTIDSDKDNLYFSKDLIINETTYPADTPVPLSLKVPTWKDECAGEGGKTKALKDLIKPEMIKGTQGDYKIRMFLDDVDTIFATDNNGLLVKPYNMLEPPFDIDNIKLWGDLRSSFFFPFDVCFLTEVLDYLKKILNHLLGTYDILSKNSNLYKYFLSVQENYPAIAYNHTAEIYYELAQSFFKSGNITTFGNTFTELSKFTNNNVDNPLSLSHGSCLESEKQFLLERLLLLGSMVKETSGLYDPAQNTIMKSDTSENINISMKASYVNQLCPIWYSVSSDGITHTYNLVTNLNKNQVINYDPVFSAFSSQIPDTLVNLVIPGKEYLLTYTASTLNSAMIANTDKYKSVVITSGLNKYTTMLKFPSASYFEISSLANYTNLDPYIKMYNYLPAVETLIINSAEFDAGANPIIDFTGCNRLTKLDLSGCTGISQIILPKSSRLEEVYLPSIKSLSVENYGKTLRIFQIELGTKLDSLIIDCENEPWLVELLISNYIDDVRVIQLKNTPKGFTLSKATFDKLCSKPNVTIRGTVEIKEEVTIFDKIKYVNKFGDIDFQNNLPHLIYPKVTPTKLVLNKSEITLSSKVGDVISNWADFNLVNDANQNANDVRILQNSDSTYYVDIRYESKSISDLLVINPKGDLKVVRKSQKIPIEISLPLYPDLIAKQVLITTLFIPPRLGDFAYSDGSFSSEYNRTKNVVGMVFFVRVFTDDGIEKYDVRIVSKDGVTGIGGPSTYNINSSYSYDSSIQRRYILDTIRVALGKSNSDEMAIDGTMLPIYNVFPTTYGEISAQSVPSGVVSVDITKGSSVGITYNPNVSSNPLCGKEATYKRYELAVLNLRAPSDGGLDLKPGKIMTSNPDHTDPTKAQLYYEEVISSLRGNNSNTSKEALVYPIYVRTYFYKPNIDNLGDLYLNPNNHWYVPSAEEVNLLIYDRIYSMCSYSTIAEDNANYISLNFAPKLNNTGYFAKAYNNASILMSFASLTGYRYSSTTAVSSNPVGLTVLYNGSKYAAGYGLQLVYNTDNYNAGWRKESPQQDSTFTISPCYQVILYDEANS